MFFINSAFPKKFYKYIQGVGEVNLHAVGHVLNLWWSCAILY